VFDNTEKQNNPSFPAGHWQKNNNSKMTKDGQTWEITLTVEHMKIHINKLIYKRIEFAFRESEHQHVSVIGNHKYWGPTDLNIPYYAFHVVCDECETNHQ